VTRIEIPTPYGPARAELHCAAEGAAAVLLQAGVRGDGGNNTNEICDANRGTLFAIDDCTAFGAGNKIFESGDR